jgi:hypothetical protein
MALGYARLREHTGLDVPDALRCLRQCVIERLVVLDTEQGADLAVVTRAMTDLAEFTLDVACQVVFEQLDALHGAPLKADGKRCPFWVVGMGKLGARELNVSSDIDLIYVYEDDGETTGRADGRGQIDLQHEHICSVEPSERQARRQPVDPVLQSDLLSFALEEERHRASFNARERRGAHEPIEHVRSHRRGLLKFGKDCAHDAAPTTMPFASMVRVPSG